MCLNENYTSGGPWARPSQISLISLLGNGSMIVQVANLYTYLKRRMCAYKSLDANNYVLCAEKNFPSWDIEHAVPLLFNSPYHNSLLLLPPPPLPICTINPKSCRWETHQWPLTGNPPGTKDEPPNSRE